MVLCNRFQIICFYLTLSTQEKLFFKQLDKLPKDKFIAMNIYK